MEYQEIHTEHQKKLITSSERLTLKSTTCININHIWTQKSYSFPHAAYLKNQKVMFVKKEKNAVKLQKVIVQKSQKLLAENLLALLLSLSLSLSQLSQLFSTFNSYSFNFKGGLCNHRDEQFL